MTPVEWGGGEGWFALPANPTSCAPNPGFAMSTVVPALICPRLESPSWWVRREIPIVAGWEIAARDMLTATEIPPVAERGNRRLGATVLPAKHCAPGILPYDLADGTSRGNKGMESLDAWHWLPLDLDAVPMPVQDLLDIVATLPWRQVAWTTWSCRDGYASIRAMLPLGRAHTLDEVATLWWYVRDLLIRGGMPEWSVKAGEPTVDPRLDSRLYFLPSAPAGRVAGTEGWGGHTTVYISPESTPVLDLESVSTPQVKLTTTRGVDTVTLTPTEIRAKGEVQYDGQWPTLPGRSVSRMLRNPVSGHRGTGTSPKVRVRFDHVTLPHDGGVTLTEWADLHLRTPGRIAIGSPFRDRPDSIQDGKSTYLTRTEDGRLWAYDFADMTTYVDASPLPGQGVSTPQVKLTQTDGMDTVTLTPENLHQGRYVTLPVLAPHLPRAEEGVVVLRAGRGRGKTELAASLAAAMRKRGKRVVSVAPLRSLARNLAGRLDLSCYLDLAEGHLPGDVATCTPSARRISTMRVVGGTPVPDVIDLLVLDEVEQQVRSLLGSHLSDGQARDSWTSLVGLVRRAKSVLLLDADAGGCTRALLDAARRTDVVWFNAPLDEVKTLVVHPSRKSLATQVVGWVRDGDRVAVHARSAAYARTIGKLLTRQTSAKVVVLTPDTIADHPTDRWDWLAGYDVVVYSPVLGTGVSLDTTTGKWDRMVCFAAHRTGTADDLAQGIARVRDMDTIHIHGKAASPPEPEKTDPEYWSSRWAVRRKMQINKATRHFPQDYFDVNTPNPDVASYVRAMSVVRASDMARGDGWAYSAFLRQCQEAGWTIRESGGDETPTPQAVEVVAAATSAAKSAVAAEDAAAVVAAADLDPTEIGKLERKNRLTSEEVREIRKARLALAYGDAWQGADDDTRASVVTRDGRGTWRSQLRRLAAMRATQDDAGRAVLAALDADEVRAGGPSSPRLRAVGTRAKIVSTLLSLAGVVGHITDPKSADWDAGGSYVVDRERVTEAAKTAMGMASLCAMHGIPLRKNADKNPMQWLQDLLRHVGMQGAMQSIRTGGRGQPRQRTYYLDREVVADVVYWGDHAYHRLLAPWVDADDVVANLPTPEAVMLSALQEAA